MELLQLFFSFVQIGLFSVGGGYAAIPLIQNQVVDLHPWLSLSEFTDLLTIAEMTPGPIAINSATFVGIRIAGIPGALAATIGCILPSLFIVTLLGHIYRKYHTMKGMQVTLSTLRPAVVALIASAAVTLFFNAVLPDPRMIASTLGRLTIFGHEIDLLSVVLFAGAMALIRWLKQNPILVMLGCGVLYMAAHLIGG